MENKKQNTYVLPPGFVPVEGGTFLMGNNDGDKKPAHKVTVKTEPVINFV